MESNYSILYVVLLLQFCTVHRHLDAQEISIPVSSQALISEINCEDLIYTAREMYNGGELQEIIRILEPCTFEEDLILRQRRALYRILAESHLYLREYPAASEYARQLVEIDPKLQVYGLSRMHTAHNKLRIAMQSSQYVDAPDLLLLVSNIRYRSLGLEVFGGLSADIWNVKEERRAAGVTEITRQNWMGARQTRIGLGLKYDQYRFPLSISLRLSKGDVAFMYTEDQEIDGTQASLSFTEKQQWLSPELWFGYQFAPKTFPIKSVDISLRGGMGFDILTGSVLEGALLDRVEGTDWYGGQERNNFDLISQKIYPAALGAIALDYRIGRPCIFFELQYRHPFIDKYVYDVPLAPYASSVRSVNSIGLQVGVRFVLYKAFYK